MGYKQPSSGLPFKQMGSSPAKQTETGSDKQMREITERNTAKSKSKSSWDIGGYLKGEQGFIPDYKGESTKKTVNKVAKKVVKATEEKPKGIKKLALKQSVKTEPGKTHSDIDAESMKKEGKLVEESMKKMPVEKKYMAVKKDLQMKPPYARQGGPRAN